MAKYRAQGKTDVGVEQIEFIDVESIERAKSIAYSRGISKNYQLSITNLESAEEHDPILYQPVDELSHTQLAAIHAMLESSGVKSTFGSLVIAAMVGSMISFLIFIVFGWMFGVIRFY